MAQTNLEVARAAIRGEGARSTSGAFASLPNKYEPGLPAQVRSYEYLLGWGSPDGQRFWINHQETGQRKQSGYRVRREYDLAHSPTTHRHRAALRQALIEAGYYHDAWQPEKGYERWAKKPASVEQVRDWAIERKLVPYALAKDREGHVWELMSWPFLDAVSFFCVDIPAVKVFARREPGEPGSAQYIDALDLVRVEENHG